MNNNNYIKENKKVQNKEKKYWSYIYEIKHIPTGKLYVGSRMKQSVLKKFEDCYTDKYMGSSCRKDGPFSEIDKELNPQNYQKTVLKVFYSEDINAAWKVEHGENGLISTYLKQYGKDVCLNGYYFKNCGEKFFSSAGRNAFVNKTKEQIIEIGHKISKSLKGKNKGKNPYVNKSEKEMIEIGCKISEAYRNKTKEEKEEISRKMNETNENKTKEEKEEISRKKREAYHNKTKEEKEDLRHKNIETNKLTWENKPEKEKEEISRKISKSGKIKYKCPYDNYVHIAAWVGRYICKNHSDKKQWKDYTKEEKENLKIQNGDKNEKAN